MIYLEVKPAEFKSTCLKLHQETGSPVMMLFADDERQEQGGYFIYCAFFSAQGRQWSWVKTFLAENNPVFESIAKEIYSANLFEREIKEMFGLEPLGNPDSRRLRLHDEVWPEGFFPLRHDFTNFNVSGAIGEYSAGQVEGEGVFEVPVGPVHAGIIGPGHFCFSAAGEPIIKLSIRLGFTHRGVEKLLENKLPHEAIALAERVAGDSSLAHGLAFCQAIENILGLNIPPRALYLRAIFLELERMYNHISGIGGMAIDVGFSFPAALCSIVKEALQALNEKLTASRFLKGAVALGGCRDLKDGDQKLIIDSLKNIMADFNEVKKLLLGSVSFMDRVDTTGRLNRENAENLGVLGVAGRASGIAVDLREKTSPYIESGFKMIVRNEGDVLARLMVRLDEFEESSRLIQEWVNKLPGGETINRPLKLVAGSALGAVEGWRGPVLYWVRLNNEGKIARCKIVDPSFRNWTGLSLAVLENIIPDFPVCNKSFDLSYSGTDL